MNQSEWARPTPDDDLAALAALTRRYSVEVTPREAGKLAAAIPEYLTPGTSVYVTFLMNSPFAATVDEVRVLVDEGMRPVPHLAARAVRDRRHLDEKLTALTAAGVDEVLLIAGSLSSPAGEFDASIDVLRSGALTDAGIRRVGLAGHPEGSPDISEQALREALLEKNEWAAASGVEAYLLTQFCFAPEPIVEWERRIRAEGNRLPVHVGLPGLASPAALVRFGLSCGVGASLKVLRKQSGGILRLATSASYHPDATMLGVARAARADPESLIRQFHFFPFGAFARTAAWVNGVRDGRVRMEPGAARFDVE